MSQPAKVVLVLDDFPGLLTHADPRDLPPGAAREQTNVTSAEPGQLTVRAGLRELKFEA